MADNRYTLMRYEPYEGDYTILNDATLEQVKVAMLEEKKLRGGGFYLDDYSLYIDNNVPSLKDLMA